MIHEFVDVTLTEHEWKKIISPEYFVEIRSIQGGPNPREVLRMIGERKKTLGKQHEKYTTIVNCLKNKKKQLTEYSI